MRWWCVEPLAWINLSQAQFVKLCYCFVVGWGDGWVNYCRVGWLGEWWVRCVLRWCVAWIDIRKLGLYSCALLFCRWMGRWVGGWITVGLGDWMHAGLDVCVDSERSLWRELISCKLSLSSCVLLFGRCLGGWMNYWSVGWVDAWGLRCVRWWQLEPLAWINVLQAWFVVCCFVVGWVDR